VRRERGHDGELEWTERPHLVADRGFDLTLDRAAVDLMVRLVAGA
jgi:hypothetical protein